MNDRLARAAPRLVEALSENGWCDDLDDQVRVRASERERIVHDLNVAEGVEVVLDDARPRQHDLVGDDEVAAQLSSRPHEQHAAKRFRGLGIITRGVGLDEVEAVVVLEPDDLGVGTALVLTVDGDRVVGDGALEERPPRAAVRGHALVREQPLAVRFEDERVLVRVLVARAPHAALEREENIAVIPPAPQDRPVHAAEALSERQLRPRRPAPIPIPDDAEHGVAVVPRLARGLLPSPLRARQVEERREEQRDVTRPPRCVVAVVHRKRAPILACHGPHVDRHVDALGEGLGHVGLEVFAHDVCEQRQRTDHVVSGRSPVARALRVGAVLVVAQADALAEVGLVLRVLLAHEWIAMLDGHCGDERAVVEPRPLVHAADVPARVHRVVEPEPSLPQDRVLDLPALVGSKDAVDPVVRERGNGAVTCLAERRAVPAPAHREARDHTVVPVLCARHGHEHALGLFSVAPVAGEHVHERARAHGIGPGFRRRPRAVPFVALHGVEMVDVRFRIILKLAVSPGSEVGEDLGRRAGLDLLAQCGDFGPVEVDPVRHTFFQQRLRDVDLLC